MPKARKKSRLGLKSNSRFSKAQLLAFTLAFGALGGFILIKTFAMEPSSETTLGAFRLKCTFSHRAQVDPIVQPGPKGTLSGHLHDFFGNRSTDSDSVYSTMIASGSTCTLPTDTAAYWSPTLYAPTGAAVQPVTAFSYYRNRPVNYSVTKPFPPDFRMIAGGVGTYPNTFWTCHKADSSTAKYQTPPICVDDFLVHQIQFPNCWDGVNKDSPNHRSHVAYPVSNKCPSTHPVKIPNLLFFVRYPKNIGGEGYKFSDGQALGHADFWNTWDQTRHENLVRTCLNAGIDCGFVKL